MIARMLRPMTPTVPFQFSADPQDAARRSIAVRWGALGFAAILVLTAPALLAVRLPALPLFAVIGIAAAWNAAVQHRDARGARVTSAALTTQLCFDVVVWAVLLYFSGGAANPLVSLLLLPVVLAALALGAAQIVAVTALAIAAHTVLMGVYVPLPIDDAERAMRLHLTGMWLTFVVSALLLAGIVWRMTQALAARDAQLAAAREAALRDERVLAMGTLAAGAAHELGTPLATMAVLIGELRADQTLSAAYADLDLMATQVAHCKQVIAGMAARAGSPRADDGLAMPVGEWLPKVHARWAALRGVETRLSNSSGGDTALLATAPQVRADVSLEQALANLLDNAARAGPPVDMRWACDAATLAIEIADHGPGFPVEVLASGGTAPSAQATGAGVGLMLTRAAIERLGGRLTLANTTNGGLARIDIPCAGLTP